MYRCQPSCRRLSFAFLSRLHSFLASIWRHSGYVHMRHVIVTKTFTQAHLLVPDYFLTDRAVKLVLRREKTPVWMQIITLWQVKDRQILHKICHLTNARVYNGNVQERIENKYPFKCRTATGDLKTLIKISARIFSLFKHFLFLFWRWNEVMWKITVSFWSLLQHRVAPLIPCTS